MQKPAAAYQVLKYPQGFAFAIGHYVIVASRRCAVPPAGLDPLRPGQQTQRAAMRGFALQQHEGARLAQQPCGALNFPLT